MARTYEIRDHHSRRLCRRAAGVARRQNAAQAAATPAMDAIAAAGVVGRANHVPAHLPAGSDVANLSLLGYDPQRILHRPRTAGSRRPRHRTGPGRLGHPLQSGDHRRPDDARLHRRPHFDRGSDRSCWPTARQNLGGDELQFVPGVSYRNLLIYRGGKQPAPFHRRHAHHAAARPDRQVGARRLSPRARQRLARINLMSDSVAICSPIIR